MSVLLFFSKSFSTGNRLAVDVPFRLLTAADLDRLTKCWR